ncbi:cupin [Nibricoccus aquaticus]|uniref:Cupin n=1 Tax=Nibricoccus aquaticus TaxID=2576891 RepID=A0A290Q646_9BACT|nr:cupin domain-containing protein [Nibricoccus aquaticus]ATC63747.1 cupin [Nibricoccus aquaticus]
MPAPNPAAAALIARLNLQPLPHEGGYFARTWTSRETLPNGRPLGTAIYFLLTPAGFSALHRLDADELWHFHSGDPVEHLQLPPSGPARISHLGADLAAGEIPQLSIPSGIWQGARLAQNARLGWALLSCTMSPGWTDSGFELAARPALHSQYPAHMALISSLTRTD